MHHHAWLNPDEDRVTATSAYDGALGMDANKAARHGTVCAGLRGQCIGWGVAAVTVKPATRVGMSTRPQLILLDWW